MTSVKSVDENLSELSKLRGAPLLVLKLERVSRQSALELYNELKNKNYETLDVLIVTEGGDPDAGFQISKLLLKHSKQINIIVPLFAKSAGTLIALTGDKILMTELSELGPLDTQVAEFQDGNNMQKTSALDSFKALERIRHHNLETLDLAIKVLQQRVSMKIGEIVKLANEFCGKTSMSLYSKLEPNVIAGHARALEVAKLYAYKILREKKRYDDEMAFGIASQLVDNYPSHGFVIDIDELNNLCIPVELLKGEELDIIDKIKLPLLNLKGDFVKIFNEQPLYPSDLNKEIESLVAANFKNN